MNNINYLIQDLCNSNYTILYICVSNVLFFAEHFTSMVHGIISQKHGFTYIILKVK